MSKLILNESLFEAYEASSRYYVYNNDSVVVSDPFEDYEDAKEWADDNNYDVIKIHKYFRDEDDELYPDGDPEIVTESTSIKEHYDEDNIEGTPEAPTFEAGTMQIANMVQPLITDEWEAIQGYNDVLGMLQDPDYPRQEGIDYDGMILVLQDIVNEENIHVGQLQEILKQVAPNAESISKGEEEAEKQLDAGETEEKLSEEPITVDEIEVEIKSESESEVE